jgi:hypothetical protein
VHPHFDDWNEHIYMFGKFYVDRTPKGHFTIGACVLNRQLRKFGWEPDLIDDASIRDAMTRYLDANDGASGAAALVQIMNLLNQL